MADCQHIRCEPYQECQLREPEPCPASMLQPVTFGDDDEGTLRVVPMRPVNEAEDEW